ncbi:hypothetical protein EBR25_00480 [bacterium]|nr:hypothetical protein [bacterium]
MDQERLIGDFSSGGSTSPTIIVMAALHGNEPAGVIAAKRVISQLEVENVGFSGRLIAIHGNLAASKANVRYLDYDLNRLWGKEPLADPVIRKGCRELDELQQVKKLFLEVVSEAKKTGPVFCLDLHTTSGPSAPFLGVADNHSCLDFARHFPLPRMQGLEKQGISGLFYLYAAQQGIHTVVVEGGQHEALRSIDNLEAAIWNGLLAAGSLEGHCLTMVQDKYRELLRSQTAHLPECFEISHIHRLEENDGFKMRPGFSNFQSISEGEHLADDNSGPISSPFRGMIFLPRYQPTGSDGFFLIREGDSD